MKEFYRTRLPHLVPKGRTFFVTFRLLNSFTIKQWEYINAKYEHDVIKLKSQLKDEELKIALNEIKYKKFLEFDKYLDRCDNSVKLTPEQKRIVLDTIAAFDDVHYSLLAACIMDNHVHILIDCSIQLENSNDYLGLDKIMKQIKGRSARYCNLQTGTTGSLWDVDSFDILIRNV